MAWFGKKTNNGFDEYDADGYFEGAENVTPVQTAAPAQATPTQSPAAQTGGLSLGGNNIELKVVRPEAYTEVATIAQYLLDGCTVFLNLEDTEDVAKRRILDFLSGVAFANRGQMKRVAANTFIISPNNVDVSESNNEN